MMAGDAVHRIVYRNDTEFNSHPFLGGLWRTGEGELTVAFMSAECNYNSGDAVSHNVITRSRRRMRTIRSTTNGQSWDQASLQTVFETPEPAETDAADLAAEASMPPLDDPNVLVAVGASPALLVPEAQAWLRISPDSGRSWRRAFKLPMYKLASLSGNGSFMRRADGMWLVALTAASHDGWFRRPVLYGSLDGVSWIFLSFITPPVRDDEVDAPLTGNPRFGAHRYMYPRPIQLRDGRILVSVRCQRDPTSVLWTEVYESHDGGRTFSFLARVNDWGAPGDLVEMQDGRIACVYGYRAPPYGIRCRLSADGGRTWGRETILRDDGGSWDLGYPRVIEHEPGRLLTVYYINCADDPIQMDGGVRHVAMTEFTPS
jgi:hypothetical protein